MSQLKQNKLTDVETIDSAWISLYKVGGVSALLTAVLIPISIIVFFIWPLFPDNIFTVIQNNKLAGLMSLDFLYLVGSFFAIPIFLTLYITLRRASESFSALALAWAL